MGYVNDTHFSRFISPFQFGYTAGTWTPTISSNVVSNVRTATAAAFTALIPITLPQNSSALKGAYLKSIDVWYKVATADNTDFATVELEKMTLTADTVTPTAAAVTTTCDSTHDTAAKRKVIGDHLLTVTLTTPVWVSNADSYTLELVFSAAATSVDTLFGARANYTFRA